MNCKTPVPGKEKSRCASSPADAPFAETSDGSISALFESGPVPRSYFHFALPVVTGMVVSLVYNMVDTFFIAKTDETALIAGVSLCAPIFSLMIALGDIMGLGGSSVISRLLGNGKRDEARRISSFCYYGAVAIGLAVAALLLLFRQPILTLLGAGADTAAYASQYYTALSVGAPFIILTFTPNNHLRTEGLAGESMIGSIVGTAVNIILDPVFIFVLGMGAFGAAAATVLGYVCTNLYYIYVMRTKCRVLSLNPALFAIRTEQLGDILAIGIPASVTNLMQSFATVILNRSLLPYGSGGIAAMGIVMKIYMVISLVLVGFAFGGQPLFGYLYGAKNRKRLKSVIKFSFGFALALSIAGGCVMAVCARLLMSLFVQDAGLISTGAKMLRLLLSGIAFMAFSLVCTCIFQSAGKALEAFLVSISRQGVIFFLALQILSRIFGYNGILISQPAADVLTAVLALALFRKSLYRELNPVQCGTDIF